MTKNKITKAITLIGMVIGVFTASFMLGAGIDLIVDKDRNIAIQGDGHFAIVYERLPVAENREEEISKRFPDLVREEGVICYGTSEKLAKQYSDIIASLPEHITKDFYEEDWFFIIVDEDYFGEYDRNEITDKNGATIENARISGMTYSQYQFIALCEDEKTDVDAIFHEFAHAIDGRVISRSDEWTEFYEKYSEIGYPRFKSRDSYATVNATELFGETFKDYLVHRDYLKETAPDIYEYFNNWFLN